MYKERGRESERYGERMRERETERERERERGREREKENARRLLSHGWTAHEGRGGSASAPLLLEIDGDIAPALPQESRRDSTGRAPRERRAEPAGANGGRREELPRLPALGAKTGTEGRVGIGVRRPFPDKRRGGNMTTYSVFKKTECVNTGPLDREQAPKRPQRV